MKFKNYVNEVSSTLAYWISRYGDVIEVGTNHIDTVIKNPKKFGYTSEDIQKIYDKYGEALGREGKAREEIILDLINKGWIRVRRYKNEGYSINISRMTKKIKDTLYDWANKLLNTGIKGMKEKDKYIPVKILGMKDNFSKTLTIQDIANDALFEGTETFDKENSIVILESIDDYKER